MSGALTLRLVLLPDCRLVLLDRPFTIPSSRHTDTLHVSHGPHPVDTSLTFCLGSGVRTSQKDISLNYTFSQPTLLLAVLQRISTRGHHCSLLLLLFNDSSLHFLGAPTVHLILGITFARQEETKQSTRQCGNILEGGLWGGHRGRLRCWRLRRPLLRCHWRTFRSSLRTRYHPLV